MNTLTTQDDFTRSPFTGYTRDHWIEITRQIVAGYLQYVDLQTGEAQLFGDPAETALQAQLVNPGGALEAIDRPMMASAAWMAGTQKTIFQLNNGDEIDLAALCRQAIDTVTRQESKCYKRLGALAGAVLSMLLVPEVLIDPLSDEVRQRLIDHLLVIYRRPGNESNTLTFRMMPAAVLDYLQVDYDREFLDGDFDSLLSMYRGDGWFIDGWNRGFDHYNFWGFMMYFHAFMKYIPRWRERYSERILEITREHEKILPYYFGKDGGPIPKGRSINYRFAVISGLTYSQISGLSDTEPGLARRMASGCLKYFWDHNCISERGLLEPGWHADNSAIGEDYTDRAAPYWAATALGIVSLPPDHAFWTAEEMPIPADSTGIKRCLITGGQMLLKVDGDRGEARMMTVGEPFFHRKVWQAGSKYYQHAYSSTLGHALAGDQSPQFAAGRTGITADGENWAYRTWPRVVSITERRARSEFDAFTADESQLGCVITESIFLDKGEIHVFWHTSPQPKYLTIGGYSVQADHNNDIQVANDGNTLVIQSSSMWSAMEILAHPLKAAETLRELAAEKVLPRKGFKHSHLYGGYSAYTRWTSNMLIEPRQPVAVYVDAAVNVQGASPVQIPDIKVDLGDDCLTITADDHKFVIEVL